MEDVPRPNNKHKMEIWKRLSHSRERYWAGKLDVLWPHGFNSAWPGFPVQSYFQRKPRHHLPNEENAPLSQADGVECACWVKRCLDGDTTALGELKLWSKDRLCEVLDWIQCNVKEEDRRLGLLSVETKLISTLKARRREAPARHFLRFLFSDNEARSHRIREVLRDPEIFTKHPNPEVAAAIMVCDRFEPQWQAYICNFSKVAEDLDIVAAANDDLCGCDCMTALKRKDASYLHNGHVLSIETDALQWPYLRSLATKGKKYRLEGTMDSVFAALQSALDDYVVWACKPRQEDMNFRLALQRWADAVEKKCVLNWRLAAAHQRPLPEGYPGLRTEIRQAQEKLVFLLDDRAPHGILFVCKRWYQHQMALYLADNTIFEPVDRPWETILMDLKAFNAMWKFHTGSGIPFTYGICKTSNKKFRYIVGTKTPKKPPDTDAEPAATPKNDKTQGAASATTLPTKQEPGHLAQSGGKAAPTHLRDAHGSRRTPYLLGHRQCDSLQPASPHTHKGDPDPWYGGR